MRDTFLFIAIALAISVTIVAGISAGIIAIVAVLVAAIIADGRIAFACTAQLNLKHGYSAIKNLEARGLYHAEQNQGVTNICQQSQRAPPQFRRGATKENGSPYW